MMPGTSNNINTHSSVARDGKVIEWSLFRPTTQSHSEIVDLSFAFGHDKTLATGYLRQGTQDYVAARCLVFNGFLSEGLTLAAQGIEKSLKGALLLENPELKYMNKDHSCARLARRFDKRKATGSALAQHMSTLEYIDKCYELRYDDAFPKIPGSSFRRSSTWLHQVDELMFVVSQSVATPFELKYMTSLFGVIYLNLVRPDAMNVASSYHWLTKQNEQLREQYNFYQERCEEIMRIDKLST